MASRRSFLKSVALAGAGPSAAGPCPRGTAAGQTAFDPGDPEVPNEEVARIPATSFGDRAIRRGHISLDMPAVARMAGSSR
jgi:hypothetical protein